MQAEQVVVSVSAVPDVKRRDPRVMTEPKLAVSTSIHSSAETTAQAESPGWRTWNLLRTTAAISLCPNCSMRPGAERLLIAEHRRLLLRDVGGAEYFFHPNLALVRGLNILRGCA